MWTHSGVNSTSEDILPERSVLALGTKVKYVNGNKERWTYDTSIGF